MKKPFMQAASLNQYFPGILAFAAKLPGLLSEHDQGRQPALFG